MVTLMVMVMSSSLLCGSVSSAFEGLVIVMPLSLETICTSERS